MKKILIISDCTIGNHFIERTIGAYSSDNIYYVIQTKATEFKNANPSRYKFFEFDPTSYYKLANVLKMDFFQIFVIMGNYDDVQNTVSNIRQLKQQVRIVVLDRWGLKHDDPGLLLLNINEQMSSRLIDYLPNVPTIAQNVGLGEGEIMEVLVPFGSSFVYRHVEVIEQNSWRIVGLYRDGRLVMPTPHTMIHPNDLLLLVGEPHVLRSVYRAIKRELGQFPAPFGRNLYLVIDMDVDKPKEITKLLRNTFAIHKYFKNRLIIKVFNPGSLDLLKTLKSIKNSNIDVDINYHDDDREKIIYKDLKRYDVGLVIVSRLLFARQQMREILFEGSVPVFKLAERSLSKIKETVAVVSDTDDLEKIATTIFDISAQMNYNLELICYDNDQYAHKDKVVEHFKNLSSIFSKSIKVINMQENPIRKLRKKETFLQCIPFSEKILSNPITSIFSTDSERLYSHLDDYHQVFIPLKI